MKLSATRHLLVGAALLLIPSAALGAVTVQGKLKGTESLLNPVWNEAKDPSQHGFSFREPSAAVPPNLRVLRGFLPKELCIAVLSDQAKKQDVPIRVTVAGGRTTPVTLVVPPGQQLQFENHDPFAHHLYEVGGQGGFPDGRMERDQSTSWTPPAAGVFEIRDRLSPSVRMWIVVEPKAMTVAYPNIKGEFAISLEPGTYTLRGYFSGEKVGDDLTIEVKPNPETQPLPDPLVVGKSEPKKPEGDDK